MDELTDIATEMEKGWAAQMHKMFQTGRPLAMALSRKDVLRKLEGLESGKLIYHFNKHFDEEFAAGNVTKGLIDYWRKEMNSTLTAMRELAKQSNLGKKTQQEWTVRIEDWAKKIHDKLDQMESEL